MVNWAREGWRLQQEALAHRGGPAWLAGWTGGAAVEDNGPPPTADEVREAVDRAVADIAALHAAGVREEPHKLPPDADRLASLVHDLLMQCRDQAPIASVRRIPPPRQGARPSYDLEIVHHGPDNGPRRQDGRIVPDGRQRQLGDGLSASADGGAAAAATAVPGHGRAREACRWAIAARNSSSDYKRNRVFFSSNGSCPWPNWPTSTR